MQAIGEFTKNKIIVKKPKDAGRLYSKSNFGTLISDNKLQLDLLEAAFLLGEQKIKILYNKKEMDFQKLISIAAQQIPEFEIKYLVFTDLRKRGYIIKLSEKNKRITFYQFMQKKDNTEKQMFIYVFSERDILDFKETRNICKNITKMKGELWFAIVDEEGDITYYIVSLLDLKGTIHKHVFPKREGTLFKNRVVVFDKKLAISLQKKEFFGKPFGDGLQLSLVEGLYLSERDVIDIRDLNGEKISQENLKKIGEALQPDIQLRLTVFRDLKKRGLIVKTGFKFGAHFRAYIESPDDRTHAEYLIHVVEGELKSIWSEISRAVRLAHSVNKEIIFARVDKGKIDYIKLGRKRP